MYGQNVHWRRTGCAFFDLSWRLRQIEAVNNGKGRQVVHHDVWLGGAQRKQQRPCSHPPATALSTLMHAMARVHMRYAPYRAPHGTTPTGSVSRHRRCGQTRSRIRETHSGRVAPRNASAYGERGFPCYGTSTTQNRVGSGGTHKTVRLEAWNRAASPPVKAQRSNGVAFKNHWQPPSPRTSPRRSRSADTDTTTAPSC